MDARPLIALGGTAFEVAGVSVLLIGALIALVRFLAALRQRQPTTTAYQSLRQELARAILLGLEFLVAADIIRSVALEPTFQSIGVLGLLVLVRTFLSWSLEVETTGTWPWQHTQRARPATATASDHQAGADDIGEH
jgi:uncharacterized membrane protein